MPGALFEPSSTNDMKCRRKFVSVRANCTVGFRFMKKDTCGEVAASGNWPIKERSS